MDVVIVRENEEDLYARHRVPPDRRRDAVPQADLAAGLREDRPLRLRVRAGTTPQEGHLLHQRQHHEDDRRSVPQGLRRDRAEYPDIENEHWIVDIGAAKLADTPEAFDVIVMPNLYGDILSDVAAQIAGSVGLAGSANIGEQLRDVRGDPRLGAAARRTEPGQSRRACCSARVMMLVHIGQPDVAERVHNAWLRTIEDGVHTYDIFEEGVSKQKVGTKEFARSRRGAARTGRRRAQGRVLRRGGQRRGGSHVRGARDAPSAKMELVGVDVFVYWESRDPDALAAQLWRRSPDPSSG